MAAALRRNPKSLFLRLRIPFASLSTAAAPYTKSPPRPAVTASPEIEARHPDAAANAVTRLKNSFRSEVDPDRLAALFLSTAELNRFRLYPNLYTLTVQKLARARRRDLIERLLDHSASDPSAPQSDDFLARIIFLYSTGGMLDHAVRTFDRTVSAGRAVGDLSFCELLRSFLKAGQHVRAVEAFHRVQKELNITPGLGTYNLILQVLCQNGDIKAARKVLDEMTNKDCPEPDIVSYTTMLEGYLLNRDKAGFAEILKEIDAKGLADTVVTYNCRIMAFCRKKEVLKAEELLDVMVAKDVLPNRASFKNIIEGFYQVGDMVSALRVFNRMKDMQTMTKRIDLLHHADTYNMLIKGLVKKREFAAALEVCKECMTRKLVPPFEPVKELAVYLRENSKVDEAKDIVKRMRALLLKDRNLDKWKKVERELSLP